MERELRERVERAAETAALFNALKHDSDAQVGAIMGPMMGENPDFRPHGDEILGVIAPVIEAVNERSTSEQRDRLEELAPERLEELAAEEHEDNQRLPDLPNADSYGEIRMRLAPNPNGPWHLGSARMPAVIGTYKHLYDGWMLCRFDDTDPETKRPDLDAYDEILSSIEYLGFEPDDVVKASDRVETYYEHARRLIDEGGAYTCSCDGASFSALKNDGEACPHRDKDRQTTHAEFEAMVDGEYDAGEMVLRVRTDIEHKNPALRDWVAFRMVDTPHPRPEAESYRCWPMLDFQSGIDDHEFGITHIVRGIDLQDSAKRQEFVYDYFGWEYPEVLHWGHVQLDAYDVELSTSTIKELVAEGSLDGWDDPRAPTVASLRRRGVRGEAIVEAMVGLGTSTSNVDLAMSSIYAENRDLIDDDADRLFFVRDGIETPIDGAPETAEPPVHPDHADRGRRHIPVGGAVRIEPDDVPDAGETVWLKGLGPVRYDGDTFEVTDDDIAIVREGDVNVIHWVPADGSIPLRLRTMNGDEIGRAEPGIGAYDPDDVVQFERIGFARIDRHDGEESVAYFAHP
ncbi:glutamate--tRNA(Glu/Gln) ligase [Natronomonas moolapensis 8.8.11]|uniref:Glutamate--tRNA ligase n=1 Tax=Natronomonas moolapensis (strain DSM 18674 / CECT 7526 / JCM 14361 / 8.8.11) TaxID=268739 RepID=M1XRM6_NATM8|nr:glutamate--tRNA ligase [Natronomonas moolapensis]CCQ36891.1 glutamate--tRNA(Glu/Gln) ligase [Natronomonas moolapensis 8.8.11]